MKKSEILDLLDYIKDNISNMTAGEELKIIENASGYEFRANIDIFKFQEYLNDKNE